MNNQPSPISDDEHRVLQFRPRNAARLPEDQDVPPLGGPRPANDLSRYARGDEPDDFRHRMLANAAAFAFTVALAAIGVWLATSIADLRRNQDCVLMGRLDCAHIASPPG
ncbi:MULTISPECIES: hypothetical protein [Rhodopseudomonas]|uniref:Uncharacterized protein n=1 Tax=Rhodopseudomonas palustris TaxID=1076 RepID=A0A0D7F0T7_RHOPL|nr:MULTISPECIES: hypothetical protein [Rhodopseudomonas]KIZ46425.1 hypothetical protein OO17_06730 [Rhodopseudomonas palustris]MDF3810162.1 hypothetical protein [Rhodopseudomonas sp. BAL398]WOK19788.1 hypothetical protein RBJ75_09835 [Rhodopseudomonas sp. BAL398]